MRVLLQRTTGGEVTVDGETTGAVEHGLVALVGVTHDDTEKDAAWAAEKVVNLRIFEDENGKMNSSLLDVRGGLLSISQFTLYGDCKKGRRPNFMEAAKPEHAERLYEIFNEKAAAFGAAVETGAFGEMMQVSLTNDGPVTLMIET
ncbi:D-tyrosyl-tRNA(Tyr) deacylase [Salsuginibacillus halophilus]|uniref:D-aminoacyl-tRNA deacylase n=1 Tax=Salsuginibacillus halophilus TaxID=517424 RepID=A0A2P8HFW0_9BACI|nr:D-aminoacyl-tRNA deacylase [Salsuginibacillus halophilus]PSL45107.1 D-tyrosyl-tRNA(Tyr) deacylase [Salsuginibacillus halophilus]